MPLQVKCPNPGCGSVSVLAEHQLGPGACCPDCGRAYYVPALGAPHRGAPARQLRRDDGLQVLHPSGVERSPLTPRGAAVPPPLPAGLRREPEHFRRWLLWVVPVAFLFLFLTLAAALASALWDRPPSARVGRTAVDVGADKAPPEDREPLRQREDPPAEQLAPALVVAPAPPDKERVEVGTYHGSPVKGSPSVLVARRRGLDSWARVEPNKSVFTTDALVSPPGYASELRTPNGVHLVLWGTLPEFNTDNPFCPYLYESAVTPHAGGDFDLDFTLDRGRVYVSSHKDKPAHVRVRFLKEVWDVTLQERETEVVLELVKTCPPDLNYRDGEEPRADMTLYVLKGKADLQFDPFRAVANLSGPTGPALMTWDNKGADTKGPITVPMAIGLLERKAPPNKDVDKAMLAALEPVAGRLTAKQAPRAALAEGARTAKHREECVLCAYGLGAVDAVPDLLDLLAGEDAQDGPVREAAIFALRRWISRGPETSKALYVPKKGDRPADGLLIKQNYKPSDAEVIVALLHDFTTVDRKHPATYEALVGHLTHPKMAVRELAYFHLKRLASSVKEVPPYDAAWAAERREKAAKGWKELIAAGKLPPPSAAPK